MSVHTGESEQASPYILARRLGTKNIFSKVNYLDIGLSLNEFNFITCVTWLLDLVLVVILNAGCESIGAGLKGFSSSCLVFYNVRVFSIFPVISAICYLTVCSRILSSSGV